MSNRQHSATSNQGLRRSSRRRRTWQVDNGSNVVNSFTSDDSHAILSSSETDLQVYSTTRDHAPPQSGAEGYALGDDHVQHDGGYSSTSFPRYASPLRATPVFEEFYSPPRPPEPSDPSWSPPSESVTLQTHSTYREFSALDDVQNPAPASHYPGREHDVNIQGHSQRALPPYNSTQSSYQMNEPDYLQQHYPSNPTFFQPPTSSPSRSRRAAVVDAVPGPSLARRAQSPPWSTERRRCPDPSSSSHPRHPRNTSSSSGHSSGSQASVHQGDKMQQDLAKMLRRGSSASSPYGGEVRRSKRLADGSHTKGKQKMSQEQEDEEDAAVDERGRRRSSKKKRKRRTTPSMSDEPKRRHHGRRDGRGGGGGGSHGAFNDGYVTRQRV